MIAYLDGVVSDVRSGSVVMQAGAFGLQVYAPKSTLMACQVGSAVRLHTHLVVKEDDLSLYGFHQEDMLRLFGFLLSVSGVGAKLAVAILSALPTTLLARAILEEDAGLLASAPGVGKKLAQRIILELKNKLPEELMAAPGSSIPKALLNQAGEDATDALLALGYRETAVKGTVAELALDDPDASAEVLIRKALAKLR